MKWFCYVENWSLRFPFLDSLLWNWRYLYHFYIVWYHHLIDERLLHLSKVLEEFFASKNYKNQIKFMVNTWSLLYSSSSFSFLFSMKNDSSSVARAVEIFLSSSSSVFKRLILHCISWSIRFSLVEALGSSSWSTLCRFKGDSGVFILFWVECNNEIFFSKENNLFSSKSDFSKLAISFDWSSDIWSSFSISDEDSDAWMTIFPSWAANFCDKILIIEIKFWHNSFSLMTFMIKSLIESNDSKKQMNTNIKIKLYRE